MEVSWDEIEKKYVETPSCPVGHFTYAPQLADDITVVDNIVFPSGGCII